ncbi:hypothetical protein R6Q59_023407 [Mikania micrantha]
MCLHSTNREVAIMILMAYLSYTLAELFYLSGILTAFFCGIVMFHYTWHNVTEKSRVNNQARLYDIIICCRVQNSMARFERPALARLVTAQATKGPYP